MLTCEINFSFVPIAYYCPPHFALYIVVIVLLKFRDLRYPTSWTLRGSPSSLLPNTGVHLPVGPGQGRNIGGSGGIPVSSKWTSTTSTILMRRQSKRGLTASK